MPNAPQLMNLFWSSSGIYPVGTGISPFDLEARAKSAAKAGFGGLSFWHTDLEHVLATRSLAEVKAVLDDNGLTTFEVEFIEDWFVDDERMAASDKRKWWLLEASQALGAHHVKIGDFKNTPVEMPRLIDAFASLCADARKYDAQIGFEFMASAMVHRLEDCRAMVEGADAPNGGLIVDIAHTNALGISNEAVAAIPGRYMISVELGDNLKRDTLGYEPGQRRYCGEGELDVAGFIAAAKASGYMGAWAVEVFNTAHADWPLETLDQQAFETTLPFFRD
ncbi:MAG: sugar phosphate isomerase/epimerase [Devosia sp.]